MNLSWAWNLALSVVNIPSKTPLEKTNVFFIFCKQISILGYGWQPMSTSPSRSWTPSGLNLCVPCTCCQVLLVDICIIPLPPLLHSSLIPETKDLIKTFHLGLSIPKSLTFCTLSSYVYQFHLCKRMLFLGLLS